MTPRWKRNAYFQLRWTKQSGAKLEMHCRLEQGYYRDGGWTPPSIGIITNGFDGYFHTEAKPG